MNWFRSVQSIMADPKVYSGSGNGIRDGIVHVVLDTAAQLARSALVRTAFRALAAHSHAAVHMSAQRSTAVKQE